MLFEIVNRLGRNVDGDDVRAASREEERSRSWAATDLEEGFTSDVAEPFERRSNHTHFGDSSVFGRRINAIPKRRDSWLRAHHARLLLLPTHAAPTPSHPACRAHTDRTGPVFRRSASPWCTRSPT